MGDNIMLSTLEDEEDLESLRLAALQSLKKKSQQQNDFNQLYQYQNHFNGSPKGKHKRGGKFFRPNLNNRPPRNGQPMIPWGQPMSWTRNTNLISVPMLPNEEDKPEVVSEAPKLILPQDRYCKALKEEEQESTSSPVSKFDRYNDSDGSEDDDSDEEPLSSNNSPLKRSDSLEALMAELENEITGESVQKPKETKIVKPKKRKVTSNSTNGSDSDKNLVEVAEEPPKVAPQPIPTQATSSKENLKPLVENTEVRQVNTQKERYNMRKWLPGRPRRFFPPPPHPDFVQPPPVMPHPQYAPPMQMTAPPMGGYPFVPPYQQHQPPPMIYDQPPPPHFNGLPPPLPLLPPKQYERPLSPLRVHTDAFSAPPTLMAPLSPRSAAFVLQNRAIIEKRKRRSYSRSPSPRFRRSKSVTPPKRRSLSPIRKVLPLRHSPPSRKPIHDRLGMKTLQKSLPAPPTPQENPPKVEEKFEDPVLEARRKKFESNEIKIKEGVIRLKTEEEDVAVKKEEETKTDELDEEDILLEGIDDVLDLDPKIDVLFSDEESNSDNEGRFKTKTQESGSKVAILPFSKLINGSRNDIKPDLRSSDRRRERGRDGGRSNSDRDRRRRSRSPVKRIVVRSSKKQESVKSSSKQIAFPAIDNKKIEIKIRNPAKYEGSEEEKPPRTGRKVELAPKKSQVEESADANVDEIPDDSSNVNEGDLRAQLSRKRAERQKHPPSEVPPTRILQNALQGVGFKKNRTKTGSSTSKSSKDAEDGNVKDGRLPIHLRLGTAGSEVAPPSSSSSLGKKRKKRGTNPEQVLCLLRLLLLPISVLISCLMITITYARVVEPFLDFSPGNLNFALTS